MTARDWTLTDAADAADAEADRRRWRNRSDADLATEREQARYEADHLRGEDPDLE